MILGKVVGSVVATIKESNLTGLKLLVVAKVTPAGEPTNEHIVAADTVGAGVGDNVLLVTGSSARFTNATQESAVDAAIVGVVDRVDL
ncbi:MAG: EutN/CcmL family microcompartment protein [Chloroflexi bacterium]|nr:EutN/CcmL family microcompartment protein [Chloroflexota bacterium]MCL5959869.1 EutN/CcmL family microcompartment protein [Chloroflexota bacterium]